MPGGPWRLALAAFHAGVRAVIAARGIPARTARYVSTVAAYAAWYVRLRQFGGQGAPKPEPTRSPKPTRSPEPTHSPKPARTPTHTPL